MELCTATPTWRVKPKRVRRSNGPSVTPGRSAGTRTNTAAATVHARPSASRIHADRVRGPTTLPVMATGSRPGWTRPTPRWRTIGSLRSTGKLLDDPDDPAEVGVGEGGAARKAQP